MSWLFNSGVMTDDFNSGGNSPDDNDKFIMYNKIGHSSFRCCLINQDGAGSNKQVLEVMPVTISCKSASLISSKPDFFDEQIDFNASRYDSDISLC